MIKTEQMFAFVLISKEVCGSGTDFGTSETLPHWPSDHGHGTYCEG